MSKTNFTEGDWFIDTSPDGIDYGREGYISISASQNNLNKPLFTWRNFAYVCASEHQHDEGSNEQNLMGSGTANAFLIVASPKLYRALESFINNMPICTCHEGFIIRDRIDPSCVRCQFKDEIKEAETVLAKARGEAC